MKGIIALDIDGTITDEFHSMPMPVVAFLKEITAQGWQLAFITGRTFQWAYQVLNILEFPYYLAIQNGAIILEMPKHVVVAKKYLDGNILTAMEDICRDEPTDFVIYSGYEYQDACFYRPKNFAPELLKYVHQRCSALNEKWIDVPSYYDLDIKEFASVKCFGLKDSLTRVATHIEERLGLHVPLNRDPFEASHFVAQATHPFVNKGQALKDIKKLLAFHGAVIAAGDDYNDLPMLEAADIKVVMKNAPKDLLKIANVIAPPAVEVGIIQGIKEAIIIGAEQ
jgi:5-amino-6-(5-phospho-D-ribitylamino)uracil phosphatase